MKNKFKILPLIIIVISLLVLPLCSHADFGDFAGDSDYGSDDSWDSGESNDSNSGWNSDDDKKERSHDDSNSSLSGSVKIEYIFLLIMGAIMIYAVLPNNKKKSNDKTLPPMRDYVDNKLKNMTEYDEIDPSFSSAELQKKIAELYVRFQKSWQAKDISDLRPYLTDAYFAQMDRQLDNYRNNHQTNYVEEIEVISVQMKGWRKDGHNIEMVAQLDTRIVDYVIDDNTGEIIRGSKDKYKLMRYEWTLRSDPAIRASRPSSGTVKKACPDCGAELTINHSGTCPYCGALVTTDSFDWAVCNIKGISQRTKNK